jgi:hypothetical protein
VSAREFAKLALLGVWFVACGSSTAHHERGAGTGGSAAGDAGGTTAGTGESTSGSAGANTGGSSGSGAGGSGAGAGGTASGAGGQAGSTSTGGAEGGGPESGTGGEPQGGATSGSSGSGGSDEGGATSGLGGEAGQTGLAGAAGDSGLDDGAIRVDIEVTVGDGSTHITTCTPDATQDSVLLEPDSNGARLGFLVCVPERNGDVDVFRLYIAALSTAVGEHDASELSYDCTNDPCEGVGSVAMFVNVSVVASSSATSTGTFTLDALDDGGNMSGSLDMTMSTSSIEVSVRGTFEANLLDCTEVTSTTCAD